MSASEGASERFLAAEVGGGEETPEGGGGDDGE